MEFWTFAGMLLAGFLGCLAVVEIWLVAGFWCSRSDSGYGED
jgi:hypothetical protein